MRKYIQIHPRDNVAVALTDIVAGEEFFFNEKIIKICDNILRGHKFAISPIRTGEAVIKYGFSIGNAIADIEVGAHVHTHNLRTKLDEEIGYTYLSKCHEEDFAENEFSERTFLGYQRDNGKVGIRNEIWIIPTVGCVNNVGQKIAHLAEAKYGNVSGIDAIAAFQHPYGCSQLGEDQENTRKILAALCTHPNAGGVLLLGLGCENSGIEEIKAYMDDFDKQRIKCLVCQDTEDEILEGLKCVEELVDYASEAKRVSVPVSSLIIGVKCGGSDGLSGITANPLVGRVTDQFVTCGGSVLMTEVPEMFGAEESLLSRCRNNTVFNAAVNMIESFKTYYWDHKQPIYENPSPGNKEGGITTLEEKSLGCVQKSGNSVISDVLKYGETVKKNGLSLISAPGNDLVSSTALAASGAHMVLFTTGRGTPFSAPVPTVKISSNTVLAEKKNKWIDFNAGTVLADGEGDVLCWELFEYIIAVASGSMVKSEESGYRDMAIFKCGITL